MKNETDDDEDADDDGEEHNWKLERNSMGNLNKHCFITRSWWGPIFFSSTYLCVTVSVCMILDNECIFCFNKLL